MTYVVILYAFYRKCYGMLKDLKRDFKMPEAIYKDLQKCLIIKSMTNFMQTS